MKTFDGEQFIVQFGTEVKALGDGRVGGCLVRFSDSDSPDLVRDFFTKSTDFGVEFPSRSPVLYNHGMDPEIGRRRIGRGDLKADDTGVWIEAQLTMRDDYERAIYGMAEKGKLGWSSGTAAHLVGREPVGKSYFVSEWPLGLDASLTPTPAEPRNCAIPLKFLRVTDGVMRLEDFPAGLPDGPLAEQYETAHAAVKVLATRLAGLRELRKADGRDLSDLNRERTNELIESLKALLADTNPETITTVDPAAIRAKLAMLDARMTGNLPW